jgi:tRNA threonylcarbamoyladenosine biosynthesis protein TsaE
MQVDKKYTRLATRRTTTSYKQTQKLGEKLAKDILQLSPKKGATVLGLYGNLGGGKTTFLQGFAKGLGIEDKVLSPTFVILKHFKITKKTTTTQGVLQLPTTNFTDFYHIDCYRLKDSKDILELDFKKIISDPKNIIAVEWPEKIKEVLPKDTIKLNFEFIDKNEREVNFKI